jgi:hypothetical protein
MKLPNAERAIIDQEKICSYLLNLSHKRRTSKAKLLYSLGYIDERWQDLERDIRRDHLRSEIVELHETIWGKR